MTSDRLNRRRSPHELEVDPEVDEAGNIKGTNHGATVDGPVRGATDSSAEVGPSPTREREDAGDRPPAQDDR